MLDSIVEWNSTVPITLSQIPSTEHLYLTAPLTLIAILYAVLLLLDRNGPIIMRTAKFAFKFLLDLLTSIFRRKRATHFSEIF